MAGQQPHLQDLIPSQWQGFCLTLFTSLSVEINHNTLKSLVDSQDHTSRKSTHQQLPGVPNIRGKHPFLNPPLILANQRLPTYFAILHFFHLSDILNIECSSMTILLKNIKARYTMPIFITM
uniref:Uncharacterized protein n=1 Tax=Pipistrellus kuhlii TaxID=59472 RepID=A0A7J7VV82_PIPKU|nr:hypothetical protein mPipKuh1_008277 [Pipistrellus kuhlii]